MFIPDDRSYTYYTVQMQAPWSSRWEVVPWKGAQNVYLIVEPTRCNKGVRWKPKFDSYYEFEEVNCQTGDWGWLSVENAKKGMKRIRKAIQSGELDDYFHPYVFRVVEITTTRSTKAITEEKIGPIRKKKHAINRRSRHNASQ